MTISGNIDPQFLRHHNAFQLINLHLWNPSKCYMMQTLNYSSKHSKVTLAHKSLLNVTTYIVAMTYNYGGGCHALFNSSFLITISPCSAPLTQTPSWTNRKIFSTFANLPVFNEDMAVGPVEISCINNMMSSPRTLSSTFEPNRDM